MVLGWPQFTAGLEQRTAYVRGWGINQNIMTKQQSSTEEKNYLLAAWASSEAQCKFVFLPTISWSSMGSSAGTMTSCGILTLKQTFKIKTETQNYQSPEGCLYNKSLKGCTFGGGQLEVFEWEGVWSEIASLRTNVNVCGNLHSDNKNTFNPLYLCLIQYDIH